MKRFLFGSIACVVVFTVGAFIGVTTERYADANSARAESLRDDSPLGTNLPEHPARLFTNESGGWDDAPQPIPTDAPTPPPTPSFDTRQGGQIRPVSDASPWRPRQRDPVPDDVAPSSQFEPSSQELVHAPIRTVVLDVMEGMSFALQVSRKVDGTRRDGNLETRVIGGKEISFTHDRNLFATKQLRIYAESVELTNDGDDFQLRCNGKVAVIASQSMLRGEGLAYSNGEFKISLPAITTPDTEIHAKDSTFAFPIGAVTVSAIPTTAEAAEEVPPSMGPPLVPAQTPQDESEAAQFNAPGFDLDPKL